MLRKQKGFTLLEMLIVIGLLVIITTVAVPQFGRCYNEMHIHKTLDDIDSLLQSVRSYYLVMNELPEDENPGFLPSEVAWAIQPSFLGTKVENTDYYTLSIKPWEGYNYDWDIWFDKDNFHPQWALLFDKGNISSKELFVEKMRKHFGNSLNECTEDSATVGHDYLNLSLIEIPKKDKENRYY